jgi:hypothetical protein
MSVDWGRLLVGQLEFYWQAHLRPRVEGLTDAEYLWEPVPGSWSLRRRPDGRFRPDQADPVPEPAPVTTIAWRLAHITVGCFVIRTSTFFGDGSVPDEADMFDRRHEPDDLPDTAAGALELLDRSYAAWHDAIAALTPEQLAAPLGPRGAWFADQPMAELIAHVNREVMHHGGELGVLRDLYRAGYSV